MGASFTALESLHQQCSGHRHALEKVTRCGCFYCQRFFLPSEILDWCDSDTTALCPFCGIDSVIPESEDVMLTADLIQDMHAYWFQRSVPLHVQPSLWQRLLLRLEPLRRRIGWLLRGNHAA